MTQATFDEVRKLVDQLSREEQRALIEYLERDEEASKLSAEEMKALWQSILIEIGPWPEDWSLNREDWYDDDEF
jgi:hypothetical protein